MSLFYILLGFRQCLRFSAFVLDFFATRARLWVFGLSKRGCLRLQLNNSDFGVSLLLIGFRPEDLGFQDISSFRFLHRNSGECRRGFPLGAISLHPSFCSQSPEVIAGLVILSIVLGD